MPEHDVITALADLAPALDWPDGEVDLTARALVDLDASRRPARRWLAPAAAAAAVAMAVAAVPASRDAIADLLGIGGVRVTRTDEQPPPEVSSTLRLGRSIELDDARDVPRPGGVGDPIGAFAGRPDDAVTLVWAPSDELPEVLDTGVGLLLTTFPGRIGPDLIEKRVFDATVQPATVDGDPAWWIAGGHEFLYLDADGHPRLDTIRLSGNALVWSRDGITYRLESSLTMQDSITLAESMFD